MVKELDLWAKFPRIKLCRVEPHPGMDLVLLRFLTGMKRSSIRKGWYFQATVRVPTVCVLFAVHLHELLEFIRIIRIFLYISDRTIEKKVPASKNLRTYWYLNMWSVKFLAEDGKGCELSKLQSVLNLKLSTTPFTSKERLKRKRNKRNANLKRRRYVLILK